MKLRFILSSGITIIGIMMFPSDALAWGPLAHLDFAAQILAGAAGLAPSLLTLINKYPSDFCYGSLAADAIIGKNRVAHHDHCHSWSVARVLWKKAAAGGEGRRAFMLGYLAHLGADVVAHNYVVPQMVIIHFRKKGVGHLYWEARADQRLLALTPTLDKLWKQLSSQKFPMHDHFLAKNLVATFMPNKLSARVYKHSLSVQRAGAWRLALNRIDRTSKLFFLQDDLLRWRGLALNSAKRAMEDPMSPRLDKLDPTGKRSLKIAELRRRALRRKFGENGDTEALDKMLNLALKATITVHINMFEPDN